MITNLIHIDHSKIYLHERSLIRFNKTPEPGVFRGYCEIELNLYSNILIGIDVMTGEQIELEFNIRKCHKSKNTWIYELNLREYDKSMQEKALDDVRSEIKQTQNHLKRLERKLQCMNTVFQQQ